MAFIIILGTVIFILCAASICLLVQPYHKSFFKKNNQKKSVKKNKPAKSEKAFANTTRLGSNPLKIGKKPVVEPCEGADKVLGLDHAAVSAATTTAKAATTTSALADKNNTIIIFYICAKQGESYAGYELLQSLLSVGLRFGEMNIFHRHENESGEGNTLFSVASMTKPGTFDLEKIGDFSTRGLSLFLSTADVVNPAHAFKVMLETADKLVEDLGGEVLDENQELLTEAKVRQLFRLFQPQPKVTAEAGVLA